MTELSDRVLAQLAKATSREPGKAEAVRQALGVSEAEFMEALAQLERECRINTAHIRRKGDADLWLALWPTGLRLPSGGWTGNSHRGLFVRETPIVQALRAASAPRVKTARKSKEVDMPKTRPKPPETVPTSKPAPQGNTSLAALAAENAALRRDLDCARNALRLGAGEIAELAVLHLRGDTNELSRRLAQLVKTFPPLAAMQPNRPVR